MRRAVILAFATAISLAAAGVVRADHPSSAELRAQLESRTALLDSHTRRLYYEVRSQAEGDDEQAQLLSDARDLWRAARRISDRVMDGASASKLEREVGHLEAAYHAVEEQFEQLRREQVAVAPVSKRLQRIDGLVHASHDRIHDLVDRENSAQGTVVTPQYPNAGNPGYRTGQPLPRVQETERRATEYVEPPVLRVGPDGFYFDGRRFTIPLGR